MSGFEIVADIVFYILSIYVDIRYIKLFLRQKEHNSMNTKWLCAVGIVVNWAVYHFIPISFLITVSAFMAILLIAILNYKGSLLEKVLVVVLIMALAVAIEVLIYN